MDRIDSNIPVEDSRWFRAPSRREHCIAASLSLGFAIFFLLLFFVQRGWWFRWAIFFFAIFSTVRALRHAIAAIGGKERQP
jgi:hypothetical protein